MATYTVQPGDTLGAIANRFGTSVHDLQQRNQPNIPDVNVIRIGQVIDVPNGVVHHDVQRSSTGEKNPWNFFSSATIATACGANVANIEANWPIIHWALDELGIADKLVQAAAIATVRVEVGPNYRPIEEFRNADGSIPARWHGYDGGANYHGRGYIQLTHLFNYQSFGAKPNIQLDLAGNPDLALDPSVSAWVLAYFFQDNGVADAARNSDWRLVRKLVQGGDVGLELLEQVVAALGV